MPKFIYFCQNCYDNKEDLPRVFPLEPEAVFENFKCRKCKCELKKLSLIVDEFLDVIHINRNADLVLAMDKLKQDNLIDFNLKLSQFKQTYLQQQQTVDTTPKCPTCGSSNIKKISATKRYVSTGLFGLGSSNIGKTRECNNCGYKW